MVTQTNTTSPATSVPKANVHTRTDSLPKSIVNMISVSSGWPGMHGTGFFVKLDGHLLLMTARHCLGGLRDDLATTAGNLLIPADFPVVGQALSKDTCIPFSHFGLAKACGNFDAYVGQDGDMDLACLVASNKSDDLYRRGLARATDIVETPDLMKYFSSSAHKFRVIVYGFPYAIPDTGIDEHGVRIGHARLMGTYAGLGSYPHTHKLHITDRGAIDDPNGMSGSPIYANVPPPPGISRNQYILIGMVVNGTQDCLEFIGQQSLVTLARDILNNRAHQG